MQGQEPNPVTTPTAGTNGGAAAGTGSQSMAPTDGNDMEPAGPQQPTAGMAPGQAGGAAMEPGGDPMPEPGEDECVLAMDECPELDSGWPGDEFCIAPPPPDKGIQVHVGPPSYDNPESRWLTPPGADTDRTFSTTAPNTEDIYYYKRQYRMREGSHHLILYGGAGGGAGIGMGRRLGGSSNSAKDNPECGLVAPENEGIGMLLPARSPVTFNMHYFNTGDEPVLNEAWVNFWFKDESEVKQEAREMFLLGDVGFSIPPGAHEIIGPNTARVSGEGRIVTMYGHYHANTVRFSAWLTRSGGQRELILEDYDWHDPLILEYSSVVENAPPNPDVLAPGGHNGVLEIHPGDTLTWECEVENQTDGTLRFANEAVTGEMCILVGDTVGTTVGGFGGF